MMTTLTLKPTKKAPQYMTANDEAPFAKGAWVAELEVGQPQIGKVLDTYYDDVAKEWVMGVILYSPDGDKVGRISPRCGGPASFEPCVPCAYWGRISRPEFPLSKDRLYGEWNKSLSFTHGR